MKFKPEDLNLHREEYQAILAEMRPKDYPPLIKKAVRRKSPSTPPFLSSHKADLKTNSDKLLSIQAILNPVTVAILTRQPFHPLPGRASCDEQIGDQFHISACLRGQTDQRQY